MNLNKYRYQAQMGIGIDKKKEKSTDGAEQTGQSPKTHVDGVVLRYLVLRRFERFSLRRKA